MVITLRQFAALVALASTPLAGCASANERPTSAYSQSEVLSELPANAPPGECYAKVVVPGEPVAPPPATQGAVWVVSQSPAGPVYCLVPTGPVVQPVAETAARYGWIRVLCDQDATPERITRVQTRLHDQGYYRGQVSGRYDRETVEAVAHFQAGANLNHGGYLSLQTLDALSADQPVYAQPAPPVVVQQQASASYGYAGAYSYQQQAAQAYAPQYAPQYAYAPPVAAPCNCGPIYAQPLPAPPVYYQQTYSPPCCAAPPPLPPQAYPCCAGAQASYSVQTSSYGAYGYSQGVSGGYGFGAPSSVVQNGWLMWNGKGRY
jgi:peptidoglycan hydrolase-like protein with peptidoglycan-binding domain